MKLGTILDDVQYWSCICMVPSEVVCLSQTCVIGIEKHDLSKYQKKFVLESVTSLRKWHCTVQYREKKTHQKMLHSIAVQ